MAYFKKNNSLTRQGINCSLVNVHKTMSKTLAKTILVFITKSKDNSQ